MGTALEALNGCWEVGGIWPKYSDMVDQYGAAIVAAGLKITDEDLAKRMRTAEEFWNYSIKLAELIADRDLRPLLAMLDVPQMAYPGPREALIAAATAKTPDTVIASLFEVVGIRKWVAAQAIGPAGGAPAGGWLTVTEAARKAKVDAGTISNACRHGLRDNGMKGRARRIDGHSLKVWMGRRKAKDALRSSAASSGPGVVASEPAAHAPKLGQCRSCGETVSLNPAGGGECPKCHGHAFDPISVPVQRCTTRRKSRAKPLK